MLWLGVDVGGTFTDLVLFDVAAGKLQVLKTPSTPSNQSQGILAGIARLGVEARKLGRMVHGTTVATNTALERDGARLAVLVTAGHKDVLVVGRGNRMAMYNIKAPPIRPLVPRSQCIEVQERLRVDGSVVRPLDETEVDAIAGRLAEEGVDAVAICFLHSYANPEHERRCAAIVAKRLPKATVTTSAEVLPEFREYERFTTTALNAYVAPRMRRYLGDLRGKLEEAGMSAPLAIMTSNGGSLPAPRVEAMPVLSMLSGPAAGVIAAAHVGSAAGYPDLITCDMGGTSTDVCLVRGGAYGMTTEGRVGAFPIKIRQIDINSIGVGGGSIAALGTGGYLTVGPRSAGAVPGPACYGRGGIDPTISDANVVLGRLGVDRPLGGEIALDRARGTRRRHRACRAGRRGARGDGGRHPAHCRRLAGRRDQGGVGDARHRSARLRAAAVRGRRSAACRSRGRRARHAHRGSAAIARQFLRAGPADRGRAARLRAHARLRHRQDFGRGCAIGTAGSRARRRGRADVRWLLRRPAAVRRKPRHALRRPVVRAVRARGARRRRHRGHRACVRRDLCGPLRSGHRRRDRDRELSPGGVGVIGQAAASVD